MNANINRIVTAAALKDFSSKYDIEIGNVNNPYSDILITLYHLGYSINDRLLDGYDKLFKDFTESEWRYMIEDLDALLSQLTNSNYKILLDDYKNMNN